MMKRAVAIASLAAVLVVIITSSSLHPVESAYRRCQCEPFTAGCEQCGAGQCCSNWGYCGYAAGYCTACVCAGDDGRAIVCDPCHCLLTCSAPDENQQLLLRPSAAGNSGAKQNGTYASHDVLDTMFIVDATYDPNLDKMVSPSDVVVASRRHRAYGDQFGSAAVCGPPPSNVSTTHNNIVAGQCLLVTNSANGKQAMVRIRNGTYYCSDSSLGLDDHVFRQLDASSNGNSRCRRRLRIGYSYVKCIDN
ncbi:unnamed protein product [Linum trigynum]|uniref:Barwin domain-containing protein n=1 Tax=Linum trigynum TaxID=586398 RepID=A0AAV2D2R9_9ROSI